MDKINGFRVLIQSELDKIDGLDKGMPRGDDLIIEDEYYFGYQLQITGQSYNLDYSNLRQTITLMGYLSTRGGLQSTFDKYCDEIMDKLAGLRFLCTMQYVNTLDTDVKKVQITGTVYYDYLDGRLK